MFAARYWPSRYFARHYWPGAGGAVVDRRDGIAKRHHRQQELPPLIPLLEEPTSEEAKRAARAIREAQEANKNIWSRAFAEATRPRPPSRAATKRIVVPDSRVAELLKPPGGHPEWEDELLLFSEELGLDGEVIA